MEPPSSSTSATSIKWTDKEWLRLTRHVRASKDWADQITDSDVIQTDRPQDVIRIPILSDAALRREKAIRNFCAELADLLVAKQKAYGPKAITEAPGGPLNGLAVRIFDKHARFQNLMEDGAAGDGVADEALADTALDGAGYFVIASLVLRGQW